MRMRVVAAWVALSCGAPQRPAPAPAPTHEAKMYRPLGIKSDAKAAHQAVILGTDARDGSTILPLPAAPGEVVVDANTLATAPSSDGALHVSTGEHASAGPHWRASVWMAAFVAATTLDKDVTDYTFSATSSTDDASSASIAAGFLAAITGARVDATATLTGTIYPDGSIGPVEGLPEKIVAAATAGKKRFGYPAGMRNTRSAKGAVVDIVALAKQHGAEAIEVADIHGAYKLLTGAKLPAALPVDAADMALDAPTIKALDTKYKQWQARLAVEWGAILQLESRGRLPSMLVHLRDHSKRYAEQAERLHKRGRHAAAYARMLTAAVHAMSANQIYDVLHHVQGNRIDAAIAALDKLDTLDAQTKDALTKIGALQPPTLGVHLQMVAAFRAGLRGLVFKEFANLSLKSTKAYLASLRGTDLATLGSDKIADAVVAQVGPTVLYVARTVAETTAATEQLDFANAADIAYTATVPNMLRHATSLQSVAAAGIAHFDALLVEPFAASAKIGVDEARKRVAIFEPDYLIAHAAAKLGAPDGVAKELRDSWGETSLPWSLLSLAGSELAHSHAAELIAKYDSLDVQLDDAREIKRVAHERAFASMLATAERNARASARAARIATGTIPVHARLAYQLATAERDGTLSDKMDALAQYWTATAFSQIAVMLARN